jgi:hypothetical protein
MLEDARNGANNYAFVRVAPDGSVYSGRDVSPSTPESEYFRHKPHPITVWSVRGFRSAQTGDQGIFEWQEIDVKNELNDGEYIDFDGSIPFIYDSEGEPVESVEERVKVFCWEQKGHWYTTDKEYLKEEFDLCDILSEIDKQLDEFDWIPK